MKKFTAQITGFILFSILVLTTLYPGIFTYSQEIVQTKKLIFGTIERKPFSYKENDKWKGYSIDILEKAALESQILVEYKEFTNFGEMLDAVKNNKVDGSIANISITEQREKDMDFTTGIYNSGLRIFTSSKNQQLNIWETIHTAGIDTLLFIFVFIILIGAVILRIIEYNKVDVNPSISKVNRHSFWQSFQRVFNISVDLDTPITRSGKVVATVLAIFSIIGLSTLTAQLSSAFTVQKLDAIINSVDDLNGKTIGVIEKSSSEEILKIQGISYKTVKTPEELFKKVSTRAFDAGIYDEPLVQYRITSKQNHSDLILVGEKLTTEPYAIALPNNSEFREILNQKVIKLIRDGETEKLEKQYLGVS
jgi:polar amino acid transport system substrate-binding protein